MNKIQLSHLVINHGYQSIIQKIPYLRNTLSKPTQVQLLINDICNLRCKQCDIWKFKDPGISIEEIKKTMRYLRKWLGPFHLTISGGEPLIRKDIPDLIRLTSSLGVMTNLVTNGTLLDKYTVEQLTEAKLDLLSVSLDGIRQKTHDYVRGIDGTHKRVVNNIKHAKKKLRIRIATIFLKHNLKEIVPLIKWTKDNKLSGIQFQAIQSTFGKSNFPGWYKTSELWPDNYTEVCNIINLIIEMKKGGYPVLNSVKNLRLMKYYFKDPDKKIDKATYTEGTSSFRIEADGKITLGKVKVPIDIRTYEDLSYVWKSKEMIAIRNSLRKCGDPSVMLGCYYDKSFIEKIQLVLNRYIKIFSLHQNRFLCKHLNIYLIIGLANYPNLLRKHDT